MTVVVVWDRALVTIDDLSKQQPPRALAVVIGAVMSLALPVILLLGLPVAMVGLIALGQRMVGGPAFGPLNERPEQYFAELGLVLLSAVLYSVGTRVLRSILFPVPPKRGFWALLSIMSHGKPLATPPRTP